MSTWKYDFTRHPDHPDDHHRSALIIRKLDDPRAGEVVVVLPEALEEAIRQGKHWLWNESPCLDYTSPAPSPRMTVRLGRDDCILKKTE